MKKVSILLFLLLCGCQESVKVDVTEQAVTLDAPANLDAAARADYISLTAQLQFQQHVTTRTEIEQKYAAERETKATLIVIWVGSLLIVFSACVAVLFVFLRWFIRGETKCGKES